MPALPSCARELGAVGFWPPSGSSTSAFEQPGGAPAPPSRTVLSDDRDVLICERCEIATTPLTRLRGLLGRRELEPGAGLLLESSDSIHTFFMRFAIDAVFLDSERRVLRVRAGLRPWRMAGARRARSVLELAAGEAERRGVKVGERLRVTAAALPPLDLPADGRAAAEEAE